MVNAVLRRACQSAPQPAYEDEIQRLSVEYSVGRPIVELLHRAYPDRCEEILRASFAHPGLSLRVNTLKTTPEALTRALEEEGRRGQTGPGAGQPVCPGQGQRHPAGSLPAGGVPCAGAGLPVCGGLPCPQRPGQRAVDLCAAPGGKSITMAQMMHNTGRLFSCDLQARTGCGSSARGLERCGITNTVVYHGDASEFVEEFCGCDRVLCDVPCSGLGVLSKKPDIRYKDLEENESLCSIQRSILKNAARYVKPGGRLVYSTCTLNPAENEAGRAGFSGEQRRVLPLPAPCVALPTGSSGRLGAPPSSRTGKGWTAFLWPSSKGESVQ